MPDGSLRNICRMFTRKTVGQRRRAGRRENTGIQRAVGRKHRAVIRKVTGKNGVIATIGEASGMTRTGKVRTEYPGRGNNLGKILLIIVLCIVGLPLIAGVGSGALGILAGIFCAFIAVIVGVGGCAIGFSVGGVVLFVMSIVHMITSVPEGIMMMGFAFIMLAIGIICIILTVLICSRLIPWIVRGIVKLFQKIFRRGGAAS